MRLFPMWSYGQKSKGCNVSTILVVVLALASIITTRKVYSQVIPHATPSARVIPNHDLGKLQHQKKLTIAFGSCLLWPSTPLWEVIKQQHPDLLLFLGDNIYQRATEFGQYSKIMEFYNDQFSTPGLRELITSIPTYAIWDDHDFGPNNATSKYEFNEISRRAFRDFWHPPPTPASIPQRSIAHKIVVGDLLILMTDNRTFRTEPGPQSEKAAYFGEQQLEWIETELKDFKGKMVMIASGGQFLTSTPYGEMLGAFPHEQERLLKALAQVPFPTFILSGDRHHAEVLSRTVNGKILREITASPFNAGLSLQNQRPFEPFLEHAYFGKNNFGLVTIDFSKQPIRYTAKLFADTGEELFAGTY